MTDALDTIPAPPPLPSPSMRAANLRAWGPVLLGVAAIVTAIGTLTSGLVTVKTSDPAVRAEIAQLRAELRARDEYDLTTRKRVQALEEAQRTALDRESALRAEVVYLGTFHPPRQLDSSDHR